MDGYSAAQIEAAEKPLLDSGVPLMKRAAHALAEALAQLLVERPQNDRQVLMLVGGGNNGGDALYAAAELAARDVDVAAIPVLQKVHKEALDAALGAGVKLLVPVGAPQEDVVATVKEAVPHASIVVDGILGTGSAGRGALRGSARAAVQAALEAQRAGADFDVVAADIPSGLDPDSGNVSDDVVLRADKTLTFGACKAGLLVNEGPHYAGRVMVVDIGLMPQLEGVEPIVRLPS